MTDHADTRELEQVAYEGYAAQTDWKTFDGRPMPTWAELPARIKQAWMSAVLALIDEAARRQAARS